MANEGEGDPQTNNTNTDGQGGKQGGVITVLLAAAAAAAAAAVVSVGNKLFGDRSVVITLSNNLPGPLTFITDHPDSGNFSTVPPLTVAPNSAVVFGSQSSNAFEGSIASVTYAGDGFNILMGWNNPRIGFNRTNHTIDGPNRSKVLVVRQIGDGDSKADARFWLFIHPAYSLRQSLNALGHADLSGGVRGLNLRPGATVISLRDIVNF